MKDNVNTFSCNVFIENCHNHAVNSLETLSFKILSTEMKMEIEALNSLYIKYCHEKSESRNGAEMFDKLEERSKEFIESNEGAKISCELFNKDLGINPCNRDSSYAKSKFYNW